jgi:hypothetical protein
MGYGMYGSDTGSPARLNGPLLDGSSCEDIGPLFIEAVVQLVHQARMHGPLVKVRLEAVVIVIHHTDG